MWTDGSRSGTWASTIIGYLQALLAHLFMNHREEWGVIPLPDVRVQVNPTRFRVPDVSVLRAGTPREQILTHPPLLVIRNPLRKTVLSRFTERTDEYLDFGIENIWIVDPARRVAYRVTRAGFELAPAGEITVPETPIRVVLSELFAELDRA